MAKYILLECFTAKDTFGPIKVSDKGKLASMWSELLSSASDIFVTMEEFFSEGAKALFCILFSKILFGKLFVFKVAVCI